MYLGLDSITSAYSMYLVNIHSRLHIGEEFFVKLRENLQVHFFCFKFTQTLNVCKADSFFKSLDRISVIGSHPPREMLP